MNLDERAQELLVELESVVLDVVDGEKVRVIKTDPKKIAKVDLRAGAVVVMPAPDIDAIAPALVAISWTVLIVVNENAGWARIAVLLNALVSLHAVGYQLDGVAFPYELPDVGEVPCYALTLTEEHPV